MRLPLEIVEAVRREMPASMPFWAHDLGINRRFEDWTPEYGWWLEKRIKTMECFATPTGAVIPRRGKRVSVARMSDLLVATSGTAFPASRYAHAGYGLTSRRRPAQRGTIPPR